MVSFRLSHSTNTYDVALVEIPCCSNLTGLYEIDILEKRLHSFQFYFIMMPT